MDQPPEVDRRRVRIGLAIITLVFLAALAMIVVIDDAAGRAFMVAVLVITLVQAGLLVRKIRRTG